MSVQYFIYIFNEYYFYFAYQHNSYILNDYIIIDGVSIWRVIVKLQKKILA